MVLREIVPGVNVHEGHGDARRGKGFGRQMRHHDAVFPSTKQDGGPLKLCRHLPQNEHRFRLEFVQMVQLVIR